MHFEISAGRAILAGLKKAPSGLVRHVRLGFSVLLVAAASAIRTGMAHPPHPFGVRWCHGDTTFSPHGLSWHPLCHPSRCGGVPCHTPWHPSCICHLSLATSVVLRAPTACIKHLTLFYLSILAFVFCCFCFQIVKYISHILSVSSGYGPFPRFAAQFVG